MSLSDKKGKRRPLVDGLSTEAKQDNTISELQGVNSELDNILAAVKRRKLRSTGNETSTPLPGDTGGSDHVYTGSWVDASEYIQVIVSVITDQNSATDGLMIEQSTDGITADMHPHTFDVDANSPNGHHYPVTIEGNYIRVKYTNGTVAQTTFKLFTTLFSDSPEEGHTHSVNFQIDDDHPAQVVRNVNVAKKPNGDYVNIEATTAGNLKVALEEIDEALKGIKAQAASLAVTLATDHYDEKTRAVNTVDISHNKIHAEDHYFVKNYIDLSNAQVYDILFVTPNTTKHGHIVYSFSSELEATIQVYEATTTSADGTSVTSYNNNRNSVNTAGILVYHTPTVTGVGTQIKAVVIGSGLLRESGEYRQEHELVLKQNTKYLIRVTNATASDNLFDYHFSWYEHTALSNT